MPKCQTGVKFGHFIPIFLAHLSWKVKWAFMIACRPSSVCPPVRKLFTLSSSSPEQQGQFQQNLEQSIDSFLLKWKARPFFKGRYYEIAKIFWQNLKLFSSRTTGPVSAKLGTSIHGWRESKFYQMRGHVLFQGEINMKFQKIHWRNLKIFSSRTTGPISTKLGTKRPSMKGTDCFTTIEHSNLKKEIIAFSAPNQRYNITIAFL